MRFLRWFICVLFLCMPASADAPKVRPSNWAQPVANSRLGNFFQVSPDLYRSAQPGQSDIADLKAAGMRTLVNLRHYHRDSSVFKRHGFVLNQHRMQAEAATVTDLVDVLREYRSVDKPVLIHCWHGSDRTGFIVAGYRIVFMNWTPEEAIEELRFGGFGYHESTYPNIVKTLRTMDVATVKNAVFEPLKDKAASSGRATSAELH